MNKILIIDPGKGWGHFVSKMYCYQKLSENLNSKIVFLTKKSTQAEHYLKFSTFCEQVIYLHEPKKGIMNIFYNINVFFKNVYSINKFNFQSCFVFHPSLRYLLIAKLSRIKEIWGLGLKFQSFFLSKNRRFYANFFSKTIKNDREALEFVKKITSSSQIPYKPLYSVEYKNRDTIGIIIAASGFEKRWPISNYLEVIDFLKKKNYKKFLIISGIDQSEEENIIKKTFEKDLILTFTSNKKISEVIPLLSYCQFCIGNDTGFSHLSINLDIKTIIIYGDCPPQNYSDLIYDIDIEEMVVRSSKSINTIKTERVLNYLSNFLKKKEIFENQVAN